MNRRNAGAYGRQRLAAPLVLAFLTLATVAIAGISTSGQYRHLPAAKIDRVQVNVGTLPDGRQFVVDDVTYTTMQHFTWDRGSVHSVSTASPQNAGPARYLWSSWSDGGAQSHDVTIMDPLILTAQFTTQYFLSMGGGTPSSGFYNADSTIQIVANCPLQNFFWVGSGMGSYTGPDRTASITMFEPITESHVCEGPTPTATPTATVPATPSPTATATATPGGSATFTNSSPITINSQNIAVPYPSTIVVDGVGDISPEPGSISLTVTGFGHTFPDNVGMVLVGPTGAALLVQDGAGDDTDMTGVTYTISDIGETDLPETGVWGPGTYMPGAYYTGDSFPAPGPGTNYEHPGPTGGGPATFSSVFGGTNADGTWRLFIFDFVPSNAGAITGGWSLTFAVDGSSPSPTPTISMTPTEMPTPTSTATATPPPGTDFDFDADGKTDIAVFRPADGNWYLQSSTEGFLGVNFGSDIDKIAPADYDGDRRTDIAVYRPSTGVWYVTDIAHASVSYTVFGIAEDLPTPADYDGDGKADISVFRPSTGTWYRTNSSDGSFVAVQFGQEGDRPTIGDFDGDGKADVAVFRPSTGAWYQLNSSDGSFFGEQFGNASDRIAPADYDGDGKTDIAIYRPAEGLWYYKNSSSGGYTPYLFGLATDIPVPGDYDGDGKADLAVFRPSDGYWYSVNSSNGSFTIVPWGQNGDLPTPAAFGN